MGFRLGTGSKESFRYRTGLCILCIFCAVAGYLVYNLSPLSTSLSGEGLLSPKMVTLIDKPSSIGMKKRTELVKKRCAQMSWQPTDLITRMDIPPLLLISDRFRVLGCKAAKVASTNLQRIFYILDGVTNKTNTDAIKKGAAGKHTIQYSRKKNTENLNYSLHSYTTFMFVRHPLERILSAFRDEKPGIYKKYKRQNKKINFTVYIDHILEHKGHFAKPLRPIYQLCKPCQVQYNFIGSLDDFDEDIKTILDDVGAQNVVSIPKRNQTGYRQKKSSAVVNQYYSDIPLEKIKQLENIYKTDYFLFGFDRYSDMNN